MRRVRLLSQRVAFDPARDLRHAAPGEQPVLVRSPLRTKRPVFKVYKSSMSPERWQQVTARAIRYCANNV